MATYIVGDIHGCFREWIRFKSKIENLDKEAEFILTGDILDKGSNSYEMLQWARERITVNGKYQMVIGNHEEEKIKWLQHVLKNPEEKKWQDVEIARKYLNDDGMELFHNCKKKIWDEQQLEELYCWLCMLPVVIEKEVDEKKFLVAHSKEQLGEKEIKKLQQTDRIFVHGHKPTTLEPCKSMGAIPGKIWIQDNDIDVDCGLVYGIAKEKGLYGDLAAFRLEDSKEFYYYNHMIE